MSGPPPEEPRPIRVLAPDQAFVIIAHVVTGVMNSILALVLCGSCAALQAPLAVRSAVGHSAVATSQPAARASDVVMGATIRELRDRVGSVKNTKKITSAMKLVAAAKLRRAEEARMLNARVAQQRRG